MKQRFDWKMFSLSSTLSFLVGIGIFVSIVFLYFLWLYIRN